MKKLNGIERNFIFQNFVHDKPTIRFIAKNGKIFKITADQYRIDNDIIEFSTQANFNAQQYKLLFPHKGRLILADVPMQGKKACSFFAFPEDLFLYDEQASCTDAKLILHVNKKTSGGKIETVQSTLKLRILEAFPLFNFEKDLLNETKNNTLLSTVNLMLRYRNNKLANEFCSNRIYFFLQELANGKISELETGLAHSFLSLIFLSEKCAVLFLPENIFKLFSLSITRSIELRYKRRFMNVPLGEIAGTIKLNKSKNLDANMALVAVSTDETALEIKRFLYEEMYRTKYGEL